MVMKTILYIHGLSSSGASGTARHLQALLPDIRVIAPDLPIDPDEALAMLRDLVATERPDIVIGTSMGGMFAQQLYDCRKILVNPAFHVSRTMRRQIGVCSFLNPRKDGATTYTITPELCNRYEEMECHQFEGITKTLSQKHGHYSVNMIKWSIVEKNICNTIATTRLSKGNIVYASRTSEIL